MGGLLHCFNHMISPLRFSPPDRQLPANPSAPLAAPPRAACANPTAAQRGTSRLAMEFSIKRFGIDSTPQNERDDLPMKHMDVSMSYVLCQTIHLNQKWSQKTPAFSSKLSLGSQFSGFILILGDVSSGHFFHRLASLHVGAWIKTTDKL